jgi:hypothetical protein
LGALVSASSWLAPFFETAGLPFDVVFAFGSAAAFLLLDASFALGAFVDFFGCDFGAGLLDFVGMRPSVVG